MKPVGILGLIILVGSYLWLLTPYRYMFEITNLIASILLTIYAHQIHDIIFTLVNGIIACVLAASIIKNLTQRKDKANQK